MAVQTGTRLGPYEILSRIGAGGMGEVFKARDTRLERSVAVKVLPAEFARDAQLKLRFEREAKTISHLEHPHICRLYDVGEEPSSSVPYLVMELLEGETLAGRLEKGPLPVGDVLKYGVQIAQALDRAHRAGIVHRDLKPGNVMLTKSGAKLLDFGLAKPTAAVVDDRNSGATEAKPLTDQGTVIGTFPYMAPEQVSGSDADARTDIFALGAVLYEMATGKRAFEGKTRTSLIAAIVGAEPRRLTEVQPLAPPALEHVIQKCLSKEPEDRWQSAHDIAEELRWIGEVGSQAGVAATISIRRAHRENIAWAIAAVAIVVAIVTGAGYVRRAPKAQPPLRLLIAPPPEHTLTQFDTAGLALSPDGRRLAFVTVAADGHRRLWVRSFSEFEAQELRETKNASYPFWSPDGRFIGFFADGKLKVIDMSGGAPQNICDAASGRGGSWSPDGTILFAPNVYSGIYRVAATGGTPVAVTRFDPKNEVSHRWPHVLPDGKSFFYIVRRRTSGGARGPGRLMLGTIGSSTTKLLMEGATNTIYVDGFILFGRDYRLMAQRMDLDERKLIGDPFVIAGENLAHWVPKDLVVFSATGSGALAYLPEIAPLSDLRIVTREGKTVETVAERTRLSHGARFSPDGSRIAFSMGDPVSGGRNDDIWLYDVARKRSSRFTFQPGAYWSIAWAPDGSRIYFCSSPNSTANIYQKAISGSASVQPVVESGYYQLGGDVAPDGRSMIYAQQTAERAYDLRKLRFGGESELFHGTQFDESDPRFSPDGRWVAYTSDQSGTSEVYVRPVAGPPDQWQVSAGGGVSPRWRADGREIVYVSTAGTLFSVAVQTSPTFETGEAKELFALGVHTDYSGRNLQDISADGRNLLVITPSTVASPSIRAVLHWRVEAAEPRP